MVDKLNIFGNPDTVKATLQGKFIVPPFSVLDARQGYWQRRKRKWLELGLQSELGREDSITYADDDVMNDPQLNYYRKKDKEKRQDKLSPGGSPRPACDYSNRERGDGRRRPIKKIDGLTFRATGFMAEAMAARGGGTSIFDPVLCELMYKWFCPDAGKILDPFAGGSVRGIAANLLGYDYTGIELREEQIVANVEQGHGILPDNMPEWICGNSRDVCGLVDNTKHFDFIFSCPPYYDLEVYSDLKGELSNYKSYKSFLHHYKIIITQCMSLLKEDRFACFVVSNIRDKKGFYLNFCSDTIAAFQKAGAYLYNEIILVTAIGSLPIRVGRQFMNGRKIGKTHQNILVFYKGDPKNIKKEFPQEIRKE